MRNIGLLIRKDFIGAFAGYGYLLMILAVWGLVVFMVSTMLPMMTIMVVYALVISLFQNEENELVCNVLAILPVRKSQPVIARYLYFYAVLAAEALVACILCPLSNLLLRRSSDWQVPLTISLAMALLLMAITMPLIYRFGMVKMRLIVIVIYAVMIMIPSVLSPLVTELLPIIAPGSLPSVAAASIAALAVCAVISLISLGISLRVRR